ncbi:MAG: acyl carrier protein [Spirochaetes bacterium]|nr:acyl carrier protein [Spirochaetota bacterium]
MTFEELRDMISEKLGIEKEQITENASFINDLGVDSLEQVELIMELEKKFDITIPDEDQDKLGTVGDLLKYLNSKLADK